MICDPCATALLHRELVMGRRTETTRGDKSIGFIAPAISWATRAVIGTLRPTEQRRAMLCKSHYGAEGNRTPDLCSAIAALYQLSYSPDSVGT